ncbi:MAG TPA: hypothetical protein VIA98_09585 [Allosphingosinicella sp.]
MSAPTSDPAPAPAPIPVVCDRCRAQGQSDEDPFARFGALLDFDPVPRRTARADGWDAEVQRAFIAALSLTGTVRQACRAVNKAAYGAEQLRHVPGNEGFLAAWDEALALAADERGRRLAEGLAAVAAEQAGRRPGAAPWSASKGRARPAPPAAPGEQPPIDFSAPPGPGSPEWEWLEQLFNKYQIKIMQERKARLEGQIIAADWYLRQATWLEVMLDVTSGDGRRFLYEQRMRDHPVDLAESPLSRLLGEVRRRQWAEMAEPERPEHPPQRYLVDRGDGFATEPAEFTRGGLPESHEEQKAAFNERHRQDAEAQIEWEAQARRDYERRRESGAAS